MARILYSISSIGLGHAARGVAVAQRLREDGIDVRFATGGHATDFLKSYGYNVHDVISEPIPTVQGREMKNTTAWYFRYWRGLRACEKSMRGLISDLKPDFILGDEEFAAVSVALNEGIRHALIVDELELGFARGWLARRVEARAVRWYGELQRGVSTLIIPGDGVDSGNRRYVGPIVRRRTRTKEQVLEEFSLPQSGQMILCCLSGTGVGNYLIAKAVEALEQLPNAYLVVAGNRGKKVASQRVFDVGVVRDGQDLVAAADLVLSTAGKSTIDEAASLGTPVVAIPIRNHAEQERNAAELGYRPEDIEHLTELIAAKAGRREVACNFAGAENASRLILSLI